MEASRESRKCRVIVDYANVTGSLWTREEDLRSKCSVLGFKNLFQLFDFELKEIHVVAPMMSLKHSAIVDPSRFTDQTVDKVNKTRRKLNQWSIEAEKLGIAMPIAPPGGLWHGEIGVDAIVAMLAIFYASCDDGLETIIFSTDSDLQGLCMHDQKKLSPLVFGFFHNGQLKKLRERQQRFVSVEGLQDVLTVRDPQWKPEPKNSEWYRGEVCMSNSITKTFEEAMVPVPTSCLVDPYGLLQVGTRQIGIGHEPNVDTVSSLLARLGFHGPISQRWNVPDIKIGRGVDEMLTELWQRSDERFDSLSDDINKDDDPLTGVRRSTQRVSSEFADQFIFEYGKERLLNHRWMKQLTTGLISDLWAAMHDASLEPEREVVVLAGNLDLEHCLRMCSAYGPKELQRMLHKVYLVFGEPPGLSENFLDRNQSDSFKNWVSSYPPRPTHAVDSPRGLLNFVTLTDLQLARLLRITDGMYGRRLRVELVGTLVSADAVDPDTAIKMIPEDPGAKPPNNQQRYVPSFESAATGIKINGTDVELIGFRNLTSGSQNNRKWVPWYADDAESVAPLLLEKGVKVPGRSPIQGNPQMAKVVMRVGRNLKVQLGNKNNGPIDIAVDDMPHRFSPGDSVTIAKLDVGGKRWVVFDVPKLRDIDDPEPVIVCVDEIIKGDPLKYKVSLEDDKLVTGELRLRLTPFDYAEIGVGDRVLALETFLDKSGNKNLQPHREFLGLSSPLPRRKVPLSEMPRDQMNSTKSNVVVHHCEVLLAETSANSAVRRSTIDRFRFFVIAKLGAIRQR